MNPVELGVELAGTARDLEHEPGSAAQDGEQVGAGEALHHEAGAPVADDRLVHARCGGARVRRRRQRRGLESDALLSARHARPHEPQDAPVREQEDLRLPPLGDLLQRLVQALLAMARIRSTSAQAPTPAAAATMGVGGIV